MQAFPSDNQWSDAPGALVQAAGVPSDGNSIIVYFICQDCADEEDRVAAAGGTVVRGKMSIGEHGICTMAQDPGSNLFDLDSMQ